MIYISLNLNVFLVNAIALSRTACALRSRALCSIDQLIISFTYVPATMSMTFANILNSLVMFWPKLDRGVSKLC